MTNKKDDGLIDPTNVASNYIAKVCGITAQQVSNLRASRTLRTNGKRGRYSLTDAVPQYIDSIRTAGGAEAKQKLAIQQERKLRLANDKAAGELVKIADAAEVYRQACLAWRAGSNALPRRLANQLSNESNPALIQKLLSNEFAELFTNMVGPLQEYFDKSGVAFDIIETRPSIPTPAPKKKPRPVGRRKKNTTNRKRRAGKVAK